jgi:hypothetical protein
MRSHSGADNRSGSEDLYCLGPGLVLSIRGGRRARAHFRAEYGQAARDGDSLVPTLEATIGARVHHTRTRRARDTPELRGVHKLARWRASLPAGTDVDTMRVAVDVRGPLGLTLVQSYLLEPLVSLAAVRAGSVLLPSAAVAREGNAMLLIGRSRSGKSSLAARALAAGRRILGDDQVLINAGQECCLPFPRRLRLYPDLMRTAPAAFASLRPLARGKLVALSRARALTQGFVAPPLKVNASTLGAGIAPLGLPIGEVVVIRRGPVDALTFEHLDKDALVSETEDALLGQRSEIFSLDGLQAASATLLAEERAMIASALAAAPARCVLVPVSWPAERAVGTLARELELER